jgi:hypothetical protein
MHGWGDHGDRSGVNDGNAQEKFHSKKWQLPCPMVRRERIPRDAAPRHAGLPEGSGEIKDSERHDRHVMSVVLVETAEFGGRGRGA